MAYTPTTWTQGVTPVNATNQNHLETQYTEASLSFNPDLFTAGFVLSGFVATKDGVTANLLDVTAGTAYVLQSADNTVRQRKLTSSTQTTSALSSTYHLWLQPDGTWYWSTSNAPAANSLHICDVTTDGSGNISTVTDLRVQAAYLFNAQNANTGATGLPAMVVLHQLGLDASALGAGFTGSILYYDPLKEVVYNTPTHGASAIGHAFATWDGATSHTPFSLGGQFGGASTWLSSTGAVGAVAGQTTAGSFGVTPIVAQALEVNVTATTVQTILDYVAPASGLYRANMYVCKLNTTSNQLYAQLSYTDARSSLAVAAYFEDQRANTTFEVLSGGVGSPTVTNVNMTLLPIVFWAKASTHITLLYQDPSGTPNDYITGLIERLA